MIKKHVIIAAVMLTALASTAAAQYGHGPTPIIVNTDGGRLARALVGRAVMPAIARNYRITYANSPYPSQYPVRYELMVSAYPGQRGQICVSAQATLFVNGGTYGAGHVSTCNQLRYVIAKLEYMVRGLPGR